MGLPVTVPIISVNVNNLILSDVAPTPSAGYEVVMIKDLGYTKLWMEFKII